MSVKLAVIGSRGYTPLSDIEGYIRAYHAQFPDLMIISGGARGVDQEARRIAQQVVHVPYMEFPADWQTYGKRAGFLRNVLIVKSSDLVLAFWDGASKGTHHSMQLARMHGKPLEVIKSSPNGH